MSYNENIILRLEILMATLTIIIIILIIILLCE